MVAEEVEAVEAVEAVTIVPALDAFRSNIQASMLVWIEHVFCSTFIMRKTV